jgi:hypothetical protein
VTAGRAAAIDGSRARQSRRLDKGTTSNVRFGVCAVLRRRFPVGANPTRRMLQPEVVGAVMEETKWLKPSTSRDT